MAVYETFTYTHTSVVATLQMRKLGLTEESFVNYKAKHKMVTIFT